MKLLPLSNKKLWTANRKRKNCIKYKRKVKERKRNKIATIITKIKNSNTVINLATGEVPDTAYMFFLGQGPWIRSIPESSYS